MANIKVFHFFYKFRIHATSNNVNNVINFDLEEVCQMTFDLILDIDQFYLQYIV